MKVMLRNPRREVEVAGNRRVKDVLRELEILPETVLVIRGDELITADQVVSDADTIELRPVMSGGRAGEVPQVRGPRRSSSCAGTTPPSARPTSWSSSATRCGRRSASYRMFERDEPVLVAVSGGKDSLALWDVLIDEGYRTTGLYLDLGIFDYSVESRAKCEAFAAARGVPLLVRRVADEVGAPVPVIKQVTRRPPCSGCGLSKRYLMNRVALDEGLPVVATGHNLDDEAATLFGSVMHWRTEALPRQSPALAVHASQAGAPREAALSGSPSGRRRPTRSCGRSTTSSRSARSPWAPPRSPTRRPSTGWRTPRPGPSTTSSSASSTAPAPAFEQVENVTLNECVALRPGDHRHPLRVLQARRPGEAVRL